MAHLVLKTERAIDSVFKDFTAVEREAKMKADIKTQPVICENGSGLRTQKDGSEKGVTCYAQGRQEKLLSGSLN